jgi:hypothetical protein
MSSYYRQYSMKSQLRNCAVGRSTRPTKLASRFDNNKENICTDWHLDQLVACRLGKISVTPTTVLPRKHKNFRYRNDDCTLIHKGCGETLESDLYSRRSKMPSVELPLLNQHGIYKNQSLPKNRIKRFYTDVE